MLIDPIEHRQAGEGSEMAMILDHFKQPRNYGTWESADIDRESVNPGCGDRVRLQARISTAGMIEDVRFVGNGCVISMAAASIVTTMARGASLADFVRLSEESMIQALQASISPRRFDCALLGYRALRSGLVAYYHEKRIREENL